MGFREIMERVPVKKEAGMGMARPAVSMKLVIDTRGKRVVFAEAGKECVDFLFEILSLPVATIINLLGEEGIGIGGSWPNLYKSLENLDYTYIVWGKNKDPFLKPVAQVPRSCVPLLSLEGIVAPMIGKKFYNCGGKYCSAGYFSDDHATLCPSCYRSMNTQLNLTYVAPPSVQSAFKGGGIVKAMATYMVTDDLEVKPMSSISTITLKTNVDAYKQHEHCHLQSDVHSRRNSELTLLYLIETRLSAEEHGQMDTCGAHQGVS